ncbi:hypothetical protein [Moorena producens]|uniref:hypothetical protein n=1 Tax=Moorena producens TaxID=1155739 RepID=UPI003C735734
MGETNGSRSWGEPPRPHCLPKTALHRYYLLPITYYLLPITLVQMFCISDMLPVPCSQIRCSLYIFNKSHSIAARLVKLR